MQQIQNNSIIKPQKSILWKSVIIILNIIVIGFLVRVALLLFLRALPLSDIVFLRTSIIIGAGSVVFGAWYGIKYIAKKSILSKQESSKIAFYSVLLPIIGSIAFLALSNFDSKNEFYFHLSGMITNIAIIFASVKYFIMKLGNQ